MRRTIFFLIGFASFLFTACKEKPTQTGDVYDYMVFNRQGGGNLVFNVFPAMSSDTFRIVVTQNDFRDTTIQMIIPKDSSNAEPFDALTKALNGKTQITGDFKQPTSLTGTWAFLYLKRDNRQTEITNIDLRNIFLNFEQIVRTLLESNKQVKVEIVSDIESYHPTMSSVPGCPLIAKLDRPLQDSAFHWQADDGTILTWQPPDWKVRDRGRDFVTEDDKVYWTPISLDVKDSSDVAVSVEVLGKCSVVLGKAQVILHVDSNCTVTFRR